MFLKNENIFFKIRRSKVTEYAALIGPPREKTGHRDLRTTKARTIFQRLYYSLFLKSILLAQNDDGPYKWTNCHFPIPINANFRTFMGPLENVLRQRILYMHLRAKLMIYSKSLYIWGPAEDIKCPFWHNVYSSSQKVSGPSQQYPSSPLN